MEAAPSLDSIFAAFRERYGFEIAPGLAELCRKREDYRRSTAMLVGFATPAIKQSPRKGPCRFAGETVRTELCELGCKRGTRLKVFRCSHPALEGKAVSAIPYKQEQPEGTCKGCDKYQGLSG